MKINWWAAGMASAPFVVLVMLYTVGTWFGPIPLLVVVGACAWIGMYIGMSRE